MSTTISEAGPMVTGEGIVIGSLQVDDRALGDLGTRMAEWGPFDLTIPGAGDDIIYTIGFVRLGRRGERLNERRWETDCTFGRTCVFVGRLQAGKYQTTFVRLSARDDSMGAVFGAILTDLDYRFEVTAGRTEYVGRVVVTPLFETAAGEPQIEIGIEDHSTHDAETAELEPHTPLDIALIDARWRSKPRLSNALVR